MNLVAKFYFSFKEGNILPSIIDKKLDCFNTNNKEIEEVLDHYILNNTEYIKEYWFKNRITSEGFYLKITFRPRTTDKNFHISVLEVINKLGEYFSLELADFCNKRTKFVDFLLYLNGFFYSNCQEKLLDFEFHLKSDITHKKDNFKINLKGYGLFDNKQIRWKKFLDKIGK